MDKYRINIVSSGRDWNDEISTEGDLTSADGLITVGYLLDGDKCTLTAEGGRIVQERRGGQNVHIEFEEGKYTECTFGSGGFTGKYEVFTDKMKMICTKAGFRLVLGYISGSDREYVNLKFTALKKFRGTK